MFTFVTPKLRGAIAQLVEQRTENPCVPGSIPGGTTKAGKMKVFPSLFYLPWLILFTSFTANLLINFTSVKQLMLRKELTNIIQENINQLFQNKRKIGNYSGQLNVYPELRL